VRHEIVGGNDLVAEATMKTQLKHDEVIDRRSREARDER
jgi:hypothetical protein